MPQKPASPVPTTLTHAEMVARLYELHDSEKKVSKRVEEAKQRLEKAWTLVLEEEERMAKVDGELEGIKDQMRNERRGGGGRRRLAVMIWRTAFVEEVGMRVEVGKRRKVARQGRDVEEVVRKLSFLLEEDRERCMRTFAVQSDEEVSGLSHRSRKFF